MSELEKVILGIENCITTDSVTECRKAECPFIACRESCLEWLLRSALSLLKAHEPARPIIKQEMDDVCSCIDNVAYCGRCGARIGRLKQNYCSNCGRAVKWAEPTKEET